MSKRFVAVEKDICDIQQSDVRVAITGIVVAVNGNNFMIDDGTGRATITGQASIGQIVRIIGRVIANENGYEIETEIVQPLPGLDLESFKKVSHMWTNYVQNYSL
jgi:hypothetical protein